MQTFLPYDDFIRSAQVLDNRRLGKQRVEAWQILRTLYGFSHGWKHHPAVKMWRGYEPALTFYLDSMIHEWTLRGFNNNISSLYAGQLVAFPGWFGRDDFHASHRSNLLRKDPTWYGKFGWSESADLPYVWPGTQ